MSLRLFIPRDSGALAVGADEVATAFAAAGSKRNLALDIVRTGSRGLYWLEPLVEVTTPQGRVAFGPVAPDDVDGLLDAITKQTSHRLALGPTENIPWLKRQTRLTFARCGVTDPLSLDDYRAHGGTKGLARATSLCSSEPRRQGSDRRGHPVRPARSRRRRLPDRHQVANGCRGCGCRRNTSSAMRTRATAAPSPTA